MVVAMVAAEEPQFLQAFGLWIAEDETEVLILLLECRLGRGSASRRGGRGGGSLRLKWGREGHERERENVF
jgi:hypothetical protein